MTIAMRAMRYGDEDAGDVMALWNPNNSINAKSATGRSSTGKQTIPSSNDSSMILNSISRS
jgi:hypothetical protein